MPCHLTKDTAEHHGNKVENEKRSSFTEIKPKKLEKHSITGGV
jgi:hypothetical protein